MNANAALVLLRDAIRIARRFWTKVDKAGPVVRHELGPCWLWTAGVFKRRGGYGAFGVRWCDSSGEAVPPPNSAPATTPAPTPRPTLLDETFAQAVRRRLEARGIHLRESIESPGGILTIVAERLGRRQVLAVRPIGAHYALSLAGSTLAIGDVVQRLAEPWTQRRSKGRTRAA
jgi:hypothetical protein